MVNEKIRGPLFVVGMWRSGTSLLYTLLNKHPEIALMYEADLALLRSLFRSSGKPDWLERWEFWNSALSRHGIDRRAIPSNAADLPTAAAIVWKQYAGEAICGEKSPNYYDSLQTLAKEFPDARFIVIWRNPADICRSIIRAAQSGSSFFSKRGITHRALIGMRRLRGECDALLFRGVPVHQIRYEEMIKDPARVLRGVCAFLGVPFDPQMASLDGADRSAIYEEDHHAGVKSTAIHSKNGKGREEILPPALKNKIERYVAYWQREFDGAWPPYPHQLAASHPRPGALERGSDEISFRGWRAFDRFTSLVYCYAPILLLRRYRSAKAKPARIEAAPRELSKKAAAALSEISPRS